MGNPSAFHFAAPALRGDAVIQASAIQLAEGHMVAVAAGSEGESHESSIIARPAQGFALFDWACDSVFNVISCPKACVRASSTSECAVEVDARPELQQRDGVNQK